MKKDKCARLNLALEIIKTCGEQLLEKFEAKYPDDNRPKAAISAARRYLEKTKLEMD